MSACWRERRRAESSFRRLDAAAKCRPPPVEGKAAPLSILPLLKIPNPPQKKTPQRRPDVDASVAALIGDGFSDAPPRATSAPPHLEQLWAAQGVRFLFVFPEFFSSSFSSFFLLRFVRAADRRNARCPSTSVFCSSGFFALSVDCCGLRSEWTRQSADGRGMGALSF